MAEGWQWDDTLFAGTAAHYVRGRLPYAPGLAQALEEALALDGRGRLLDVGCGPGTVTLRFAPMFEEAVGLDPDPGMLAEAGRLGADMGIDNCRWVRLRAEELPAGLGTFRAITFAASFHWMDRDLVARTVHGMLGPGGAVVHVDNRHQDGTPPLPDAPHPAPPDAAIRSLIESYLGVNRRAGQGVRNSSPSGEPEVFAAAGFGAPRVVEVPDGRSLVRTIEQVLDSVFSMSWAAPHLFGTRLAEFERDLRALLARESRDGRFSVQLPDNRLVVYRPV